MKDLELYIHIPFCVKKCLYCDFLSFPSTEEVRARYVEALCREIEKWGKRIGKESLVVSLFFGGGTPTVLTGEQIKTILEQVNRYFGLVPGAEITMECNPGTVTEEKLRICFDAGVNRLSIGLQTTREEELKRIGRIHSYEDFVHTYQMAREVGFENINVDLISALPGQTMEHLEENLDRILSLPSLPEHISSYSLILEENTGLWDLVNQGLLQLPEEDLEREMYWHVIDRLGQAGYRPYEISNLARPGFECKHNLGYWTGREYLGLGLGAASYLNSTRFSNTGNLEEYLEGDAPYSEFENLSKDDKMQEFMFLGLRLWKGICEADFQKRFGVTLDGMYGAVIQKNIDDGLLKREDGRLSLTHRGMDLANYVFAQFV